MSTFLKNITKISLLVFSFGVLAISHAEGIDPEPRCHLFLKTASPIVVNLEHYISVRYDSAKFCTNTPVSKFHCFSYYEDKGTCNSTNKGLVKLYIKDLVDNNIIVR
jgi:hypothetical protein